MKRYRTNRRKDRRIFQFSANRTRAINLRPMFRRGGIRL